VGLKLLRSLLRLPLEEDGSEALDRLATSIGEAPASAWTEATEALRLHELLPFAGYGLRTHRLEGRVPPATRDTLASAYYESLLRNLCAVELLKDVHERLVERGVEPVLWKGIVLATAFYPDLGARPMADLDLAIDAAERIATLEVLEAAGLVRRPELDTADAIHLEHPCGVLIDLHHRVRLFEGHERAALSRPIALPAAGLDSARVLGPEAMITHLVVHLSGHLRSSGPLLRWVLDFAPVARRWGAELDRDRTLALLPSPHELALLLRLFGFLDRELGQPPPPAFAGLAAGVRPLALAEILRRRRLAQWGLHSPRGWARLALCRLGLRARGPRAFPRAGDFARAPGDALREWEAGRACAGFT
jgi:hypothetical protein